jgi:hypothetical protein
MSAQFFAFLVAEALLKHEPHRDDRERPPQREEEPDQPAPRQREADDPKTVAAA